MKKIITTIDSVTGAAIGTEATTRQTADSAVTTAFTAADTKLSTDLTKAFTDADTAIGTAYKAADKVLSDAATALTTRVTTAEGAIADNKTTLTAHAAIDTDLTQRMVTAENLLGKKQAIRLNRLPGAQDQYEAGTIWEDISFGETTPLRLVATKPGVWVFQNQITLTKIRIFIAGRNTSYRSNLSNVRFFKPDGSQIPNSWFVYGAVSAGIGSTAAGVAYNGGTFSSHYASGWFELEVSSLFDGSISIGKILGDYASGGNFVGTSGVEFYYSNASKKSYGSIGWASGTGLTLCNVDPVLPCRYGDSVASVLGQTLTAAQLSDANSIEVGRVTGEVFTAAFNQLFMSQPQVLAAYQQETIDALVARIAALENQLNP